MAINDMIEFNGKFNKPLDDNKIVADTKFLRNKQYIYGNQNLMDFLELTNDDWKELQLESIFEIKSKQLVNKEYSIRSVSDVIQRHQKGD